MTATLNYIALGDHTGYACAAEGYVRILRAAGVNVNLQTLRPGPGLGLWYECDPLTHSLLDPNAITILHVVPEYYAPLKQWLAQRGVRTPMIGMTVWETNRTPAHWPPLLNAMDALIVPTEWNQQVFQACGVSVPVFIVPHVSQFSGDPADENAMNSLRSRIPDTTGHFVFYSIGAWSLRKGNDLLVRAFQEAFAGRNDVMLILKTSATSLDPNPHLLKRMLRKATGKKSLHQKLVDGTVEGITVLTDELAPEGIRALHTLGDCYVSCARGEGWAMGLYEAVLFGNPVLAPREGGHRAYLKDKHSPGLLDGNRCAVITQGFDASYTSDQEWYEVNVSAAARKMTEAMDNTARLRQGAEAAREHIISSFSDAAIADTLLGISHRFENISTRSLS